MDGGCGTRALLGSILALAVLASSCVLVPEPSVGLACQDPPSEDEVLGDRQAPRVIGMTPDAAGRQLDEAGISVTWRYEYDTDPNDSRIGYAECWCKPPPDGLVRDVIAEPGDQLIVFVERSEPIAGGRPQPVQGWGCPDE